MANILVSRKEFLKALLVGGAFAGRARTMPVLNCVKCEVKDGWVGVTSFSGEIAVTSECAVLSSDKNLAFCVDASDITRVVKLISSDTVELLKEDGVESLTVRHPAGETTLATIPAEDFPEMMVEDEMQRFDIDSALLSGWLRNAQRFIVRENISETSRPVLACLYLYKEGEELGYCASDSKRLITESAPYDGEREASAQSTSLLVQWNAFKALGDIAGEGERVAIEVGTQSFRASCGDSLVCCRLVEGRYPKFRSVIPTTCSGHGTAQTEAFLASVARAAVSSGSCNTVILATRGNGVELRSEDLGFGKRTKETCAASCDGEITLGLRADYLADALSCIDTETVLLEFSEKNKPLLLKEEDNKRKTILLMPVVVG